MNSLKKALACLSVLAIIFVSFSCRNASSDDDIINDIANNGGSNSGNNDNNGSENGGDITDSGSSNRDKLVFDLSNAKSFFAGKTSSSTASRSAMRAIDDNSVILMKIMDDGTIKPAMDFKGDNIDFRLEKILKNPATRELFLLGNFNKWSSGYYDDNGNWVESDSWNYRLIRVAQNGTWHGLPDIQDIQITQEPFDEQGNFYFQRTDYSSSTSQSSIYKYSGSTATKIQDKANLKRILPNGTIIYSVENQGINNNSYYYLRLKDGKTVQLEDYSTSVYVKDKNIFYYSIKYKQQGEDSSYYVDEAGNKYYPYEVSASNDYVYYANKGGKKIYVTQDGDSWKDENGKSYDSHVFSVWDTRYVHFDDDLNKIYVTYVDSYYEDKDGNRYDSCDKSSEYEYWILKNGEKITVKYSDGYYRDSEGNTYNSYDASGYRYYVIVAKNLIEVEYFSSYYEDAKGNKYNSYDKSEWKEWFWIYEGGESVKVENNNDGYYYDEDGNKYRDCEVYSVSLGSYYYAIQNDKEVRVTPVQEYATDVIVAKYYDFLENKKLEAVAEADFSGLSYYDTYFTTSSENVFGTNFITNSVWKFEIQDDFSLKCKYNLSEKGYAVATVWTNDYSLIGENSNRYLEKFLYNGNKIYFLGTKGASWSSDASYNLYKIVRFGEPQAVLSDASNYSFNGNITFTDDGDFIGSVLRKSDGKWGTLSGSMEYGTYEFKEDNIFESVKDIVINFD